MFPRMCWWNLGCVHCGWEYLMVLPHGIFKCMHPACSGMLDDRHQWQESVLIDYSRDHSEISNDGCDAMTWQVIDGLIISTIIPTSQTISLHTLTTQLYRSLKRTPPIRPLPFINSIECRYPQTWLLQQRFKSIRIIWSSRSLILQHALWETILWNTGLVSLETGSAKLWWLVIIQKGDTIRTCVCNP